MASRKVIADDLFARYGAVLSITEVTEYTKMSRDWCEKILHGVERIGTGTGKRVFYKDVAAAISNF